MSAAASPAPAPAVTSLAAADAEFERRCAEVERTAREWGLRAHQPEGRFISALLTAIRTLGELGRGSHGVMEAIARAAKQAAEADVKRAQELREHAELELLQVRNLQVALVVEHENVTLRMIKEVFPLFAEKLEGALVIREKEWNRRVEQRRFALAGATVLAIFLAGIGLEMWRDWDRVAIADSCAAHAVVFNNHVFCDVGHWEPQTAPATKQ